MKVIDYTKYYSQRKTGRPKKSDYVVDGMFETIGQMRARIHREVLSEERLRRENELAMKTVRYPAYFWTPRKTENVVIANYAIWSLVTILGLLSLATK